MLPRRDAHTALIGASEDGPCTKVSYAALASRVRACAGALRALGVSAGDRVAGYLPNCPATVEVFLAAASIGAIWSSASPDFGTTGVLERFSQIRPKVLVSVNAVMYNGKAHDHLDKLRVVVDGLEGLEAVVVLPFVDRAFELDGIKNGYAVVFLFSFFLGFRIVLRLLLLSGASLTLSLSLSPVLLPSSITYADFLAKDDKRELEFAQLPFDHPLIILFSSGTTGKPKCIVHSAGVNDTNLLGDGPLSQYRLADI